MAKDKKTFSGGKVGKFFKKIWFKICGFFVRTYHEMRRVRWPGKKTMISATCIVLSFVFLFGAYIILDDFIIAQIFRRIY